MLKKRFLGILIAVPAIIFLLSLETKEQSPIPSTPPPPVLLKSGDLKWKDAPPAIPKGAKAALVYGEPLTGPYAQFVKVPKGYVFRPHYHTQNEWVTVISGRILTGFGTEIDMSAGKELTAGGFGYIPAGTGHWAMAREETVFYQYVGGIASMNYYNQADDPRSKPR